MLGKSFKIVRLRFDCFQWILISKAAQRSFSLKDKTSHSILNKYRNRKVLLSSKINLDSIFATRCGDKIPLQRQRFLYKAIYFVAATCRATCRPTCTQDVICRLDALQRYVTLCSLVPSRHLSSLSGEFA